LNTVKIGWIDYSEEHKNRVIDVLDIFKKPGTIDKLGIGIIRDAFSEKLFPGTSTIQTRAKYLLFIPYIMRQIELKRPIDPQEFLTQLHKEEINLISKLKGGQDRDGIIGIDAGKNLQRKPSSIYWSGLRTFDIFTDQKLSLKEYVVEVCSQNKHRHSISALGNSNDETKQDESDDFDVAYDGLSRHYWRIPENFKDWKREIKMGLYSGEAVFLRDRIVEKCRNSLLGYVLDNDVTSFIDPAITGINDLRVLKGILPIHLWDLCAMAISFANFIEGAHIRYNVILSKSKTDKVEKWNNWFEHASENNNIDLVGMFCYLQINDTKGTLSFLKDYQSFISLKDLKGLDDLLTKRERRLKSPARAKLCQVETYPYKDWEGIEKIDYRLRVAKKICADIFNGLEVPNAKASS